MPHDNRIIGSFMYIISFLNTQSLQLLSKIHAGYHLSHYIKRRSPGRSLYTSLGFTFPTCRFSILRVNIVNHNSHNNQYHKKRNQTHNDLIRHQAY